MNIIFQWTPRHANASNVSYEFELRELWDTQIAPEAAFLTSPNYYTETTATTTLLYHIGKPTLLPNKRYGWRVRAVSRTGLSKHSVFKNDGYSEIYYFTYNTACYPPRYVLSEAVGKAGVQIRWQGMPEHKRYHVQYKRADIPDAEWFEVYTYNTQVQISNLRAGKTYVFRVGGSCNELNDLNPLYAYSAINEFSLPAKNEKSSSYTCGIVPEIEISNTQPLQNIGINETFTAGDFPVTIKQVSGSNGRFRGVGYIVVPYLADTKLAVSFTNIRINTDYQLIEGVVSTTYDATWGDVESADDMVDDISDLVDTIYDTIEDALEDLGIIAGDYEEETLGFVIEEIKVNENGETVIIGTNGEEQNLGLGNNTVVKDENGKTIVVNKNGETGAVSESDDLKEITYYVEVSGRTKKYKHNGKIFFVRQKTNGTLNLRTTIDSLKFSNPEWKIGSVNLGKGDSISVDLKTLIDEKINIVDIDDNSKRFTIKKIKVYDKPVTNIKKNSGFGGYFGFDEAEEVILQNNGDYKQFRDSIFHKEFSINKIKKYFVKWVTLTPGQTVGLTIDKTFIKSEMKKDSTFSIKFKSSTPDLTFIYSGTQELFSSYDDLDFPLQISAGTVTNDADFNTPYTITAYDQSNELIGKINVVLGKIRETKEIVLVKIKHDNNSYPNYNIRQTISLLNQESYNQAFINWKNITTDTLNISTQYAVNPSLFNSSSGAAINRISYLYKQNKTMDSDKYYVFVTDIRVATTNGNVAGRALGFNTNSLILLKDRGTKTIIHEIGHCLDMKHTFDNGQGARKIPEKTTRSFMDYSTKRNMFFLYQLKHLSNYQFPQ
ncbi:conserved hypothetical protein [Tenacibaculum maritimum]|nr:conserved hypothetical protein [Tenacibaculum maritimum]